ncbi:ACBD6 [Symbiodinium natans]|uniref:ACBD6 protein n=1 Tax=Symbiodinium natans TaxID=878477 RepID=A0A812R3U1_9DINO|nr:ACBD6 [Symbiodinium natans]
MVSPHPDPALAKPDCSSGLAHQCDKVLGTPDPLATLPLAEPSANLPRMEIPAPAVPLPSTTLPGAAMVPASGGISARSGASGSPFEERSTQLVPMGETRKVEELLADDRFLDSLAGKLANRLGGMGLQGPSATARGASATLGGTFLGHMKRPEPPAFQEGAIGPDGNKATLPRALQVGGGQPVDKTSKGVQHADNNEVHMTNMDVNAFTQEKMRGECYVRLLVHPDAASAKKAIVPYQGDMMNPDISLVMGANRPNLVVPPKAAVPNEEGELMEDDEFADFEKHDNVAFSFVRHNRYEAIEAIIQQESGILEAKDEFGNNMLHIACQNDHRRIAKLLLKNGINVNDQNKAGNTPLHYCFQYNFLHLSDYLIAHGADETIANKKGLLPSEGTGIGEGQ